MNKILKYLLFFNFTLLKCGTIAYNVSSINFFTGFLMISGSNETIKGKKFVYYNY